MEILFNYDGDGTLVSKFKWIQGHNQNNHKENNESNEQNRLSI